MLEPVDNLTNGDAMFVPNLLDHSLSRDTELSYSFISASDNANDKLAYVDPNTKHAIMKVDNTTVVPFNDKRNTVRINTADRYGVGSVWVADMMQVLSTTS